VRSGKRIPPVRLCGIGILPMTHGLEGPPNAGFCIGDPKPMPRGAGFSYRAGKTRARHGSCHPEVKPKNLATKGEVSLAHTPYPLLHSAGFGTTNGSARINRNPYHTPSMSHRSAEVGQLVSAVFDIPRCQRRPAQPADDDANNSSPIRAAGLTGHVAHTFSAISRQPARITTCLKPGPTHPRVFGPFDDVQRRRGSSEAGGRTQERAETKSGNGKGNRSGPVPLVAVGRQPAEGSPPLRSIRARWSGRCRPPGSP
jgi:hypothetical protein